MPVGERDSLVAGTTLSTTDGTPRALKVNKFRGLICWGVFGAFLIFFIIMTSVYTHPKDYEAATPASYLNGEDKTLYQGLGPISFVPTTRKMNAMANFQLGVQLMNLFWYDLAIQKFQKAQQQDPKLAMAYWGEAMCYKRPLWQDEDIPAAQAVFEKMNVMATGTITEQEQAYIDAAKVYLSTNGTLEYRERTYTNMMMTLVDQFQDDPDACGLVALSLLGQLYSVGDYLSDNEREQVRNKAEDYLSICTSNNYYPTHAGLLHYQVALYDVNDPNQAMNGINPALKLSKTAPASNLAQHMRSHIFMRFGNWSQVVSSNQAAVAASDSYCNAMGLNNTCDADNRWHALEWQLYGQTQQCAFSAASTTYKRMQSVAASMNYSGSYGLWLYRSYAHMQLQSLNSLGPMPLRTATDNATSMLPAALYDASTIQTASDISDHFWPPHAESNALLARIYSLVASRTAAQQQAPDVQATVKAALARLDAIVAVQNNLTAAANGSANAPNADMVALLQSVRLQAYALVSATACAASNTANCTNWVPLMDQALALYNSSWDSTALPTLKIAPAPEFYGNLLLLNKTNATGAAAMFNLCLAQLPGRMQCMSGRARAADSQGDTAGAKKYYGALLSQCGSGDASFPGLMEARRSLGLSPPPPSNKRGAMLRRGLRAAGQESGVVTAAA